MFPLLELPFPTLLEMASLDASAACSTASAHEHCTQIAKMFQVLELPVPTLPEMALLDRSVAYRPPGRSENDSQTNAESQGAQKTTPKLMQSLT